VLPAQRALALSPVHTSNNVEATFHFVVATFDFVAKQTAKMSNEFIVKFRPFDNIELLPFLATTLQVSAFLVPQRAGG